MRHTARGPLALATLVAAAALLTAVPTSSAEPAAVTEVADRTDRRGAGDWAHVAPQAVYLSRPAMLRTADGVLHLVYTQATANGVRYEHATITAAGTVGTRTTVVPEWRRLADPTALLPAPGGMRLVFAGAEDFREGHFFNSQRLFHALSDTTGAGWSLPEEALTKSTVPPYDGTAAVALPDGTPVSGYVRSDSNAVAWRSGTIPAAALAPGNTTPEDAVVPSGPCCPVDLTLARAGDEVWATWAAYDGDTGTSRTVVRRIHPTLGPELHPPRAAESGGRDLVARPDGSVVLSYCRGVRGCRRLVLWDVGSRRAVEVPVRGGARRHDLHVTASGRIWVAWIDDERAYAVRTRASGLGLEGVRSAGSPPDSWEMFRVKADGTNAFVDVVATTSQTLSHVRLLPGLVLTASPRRWDGDRARTVRFKVKAPGAGPARATVRAAGQQCRTDASGVCRIRVAPRRPGRVTATASSSKRGYQPVRLTLRARR